MANSSNPKVIKFNNYSWPVEDPVEMVVECEFTNEDLTLKSYRYPAYYDSNNAENAGVKGVVFYSHGFSEYTGR